MLICCTAASAPPGVCPLRMRISPMWLTSKTPTPERTALCSATRPPVEGYSTGISHPPKLTIFAPKRRCTALSGVLRSSVMGGVVTDSIPCAQAEIDTNMRLGTRQRRAHWRGKAGASEGTRKRNGATDNVMEEKRHSPNVQLAGFSQRQVQFSGRLPCRVQSFADNVTRRKAIAIAKSIARFAKGRLT